MKHKGQSLSLICSSHLFDSSLDKFTEYGHDVESFLFPFHCPPTNIL
jgi:hypothetical protein